LNPIQGDGHMPLIDLWQGNQSVVQKMTIEQIVTTAGDGRARDGSACQEELRTFLSKVPSTDLSSWSASSG
jgi:hypothetical protein